MAICLSRVLDSFFCNFLLECFQSLVFSIVFKNVKNNRYRSIVRIVGNILPLPKAPRVYFNLAAWRHAVPDEFLDDETSTLPQSKNKLTEKTQYGSKNSEKDSQDTTTVLHIQQELEELKKQIALILENNQNCNNDNSEEKENEQENKTLPNTIPQRPLSKLQPEALVQAKRSLHSSSAKNTSAQPQKKMPSKLQINPEEALTEVLRKRFFLVQFSDDSMSDASSNFG